MDYDDWLDENEEEMAIAFSEEGYSGELGNSLDDYCEKKYMEYLRG